MYDKSQAANALGIAVPQAPPAPLGIRIDQLVAEASKSLESVQYLRDRMFGASPNVAGNSTLSEVKQSSVENAVDELAVIISRINMTLESIHGRI